MAISPTTVAGIDGGSSAISIRADRNSSDSSIAFRSSPEIAGAAASAVNPVPSAKRAPIAPIASTALETGHVLAASPCTVFAIHAAPTVSGWVVLLNTTSVPTTTSAMAPLKVWHYDVGVGHRIDVSFDPPLAMSAGAVLAFTTNATPLIMTQSATCFLSAEVA